MTLQKHNHIRSKAITQAANGEACTICGLQNDTVVFAHINEPWAGKGMGIKADDMAGMFLCEKHHDIYDGRIISSSPIQDWEITRAMYRTWRRLWERGIIGEL